MTRCAVHRCLIPKLLLTSTLVFLPFQLTKARFSGAAFGKFSEGKISFPPTFKFNKNGQVYDTSKKKRVPAWTDRVLYMGSLELLEYASVPSAKTSDHRPVYATFRLPSSAVDGG
jgi:hypothetical protein